MKDIFWEDENTPMDGERLNSLLEEIACRLEGIHSLLLIPPDFTRCYSMAGEITRLLYEKCRDRIDCIHIMPAVGTHMEMSLREKEMMFGKGIPQEAFLCHDWKKDTVSLGSVPGEFVREVSEGMYDAEIEVEVNRCLFNYEQVISIGQVVPHEVVGMANYSKNIFVGTGGRQMINHSHMLGAVCGIENMLGVRDTPVRRVFDYAQERYLAKLPLLYIQTVTREEGGRAELYGFYAGASRKPFEQACALSQRINITRVCHKAGKVVVYLDGEELKSIWVGNKGIYRTRMILEEGGELLLLAPGVRCFGENAETDRAIRKTGYRGRDQILKLWKEGRFADQYMVAAHLIHGSPDGKFSVTYATRPENLSKEEVNSVGYHWMDYDEAAKLYPLEKMTDGFHCENTGEEFYFIRTPAMGLWKC